MKFTKIDWKGICSLISGLYFIGCFFAGIRPFMDFLRDTFGVFGLFLSFICFCSMFVTFKK